MNEKMISFFFKKLSTLEVENIHPISNIWKTQWQGKLQFAHGSNHSCGVMILLRSDLDFSIKSVNLNSEGRSIIMEADIQGSLFLFVNIYAPIKVQDQCQLFDNLSKKIEDFVVNKEHRIIRGEALMLHSTLTLTVLVENHLKKTLLNK